MQTQGNEFSFEGQNIYVGIDVHLKSWTVTILTEHLLHKTFNQPPNADALRNYLHSTFPKASYYSVYEAGFCGFSSHYRLMDNGINNIVVNPADVPSSQKDTLRKDDPVDSRKLAYSLRAKMLKGIYIPSVESIADRSLIRIRAALVKDLIRYKLRAKSFLYFHGIEIPEQFKNSSSYWSNRYIKWFKEEVVFPYDTITMAKEMIIDNVEHLRQQLLDVLRKLRKISNSEKLSKNVSLLTTVPGMGLLSSITFLLEIDSIERFKNTDHLAGFVGIIPNQHSSGERSNVGEMTFRGNKILRRILVENAWVATRTDPALSLAYHKLVKRMEPNKAIIRVARKLLNRIYYVLKNHKEYVLQTV